MRLLRPLCLAALVLAVSACAINSARGPRSGADEVAALFNAGIESFNRHDLETFTAQFADDIVMYTPTGWVRGRRAVVERFRGTFAQFPNVRMVIDSLEVRGANASTTTVAFRWKVYPMGQGPAFHGVGSGVYVRRDDRWVEVLEHETITQVDPELQRGSP